MVWKMFSHRLTDQLDNSTRSVNIRVSVSQWVNDIGFDASIEVMRPFSLGLTIAAIFIITIVIDSQKYYHDSLSIVDFTIAILSR